MSAHEIPPLPIEAQPYKSSEKGIPGHPHNQWLYRFPNGFGASVIKGSYTYGGPAGFYELAVILVDDDGFEITYDTPITSDVLGWLSVEEVAATLVKVAAL